MRLTLQDLAKAEELLGGQWGPDAEDCERFASTYGRALIDFAREALTPRHASDCAVHNEPAMPNGPCDCGAEAAPSAETSASSPSEASAGNLPQDEPNYKAFYTELKGEVSSIADDYMTSERHHPGYVLIPTVKFERLRSIGGSSSAETAASLADGKLTAGEAQRKSEGEGR